MPNDSDEIIAELYDLVSSPDQYDSFMLNLERKLQKMKLPDGEFAVGQVVSHMKRASA